MSEPAGVAVRRRTLIESGLAVIAALVAAVVPHNPLRAWSSTPQAPYAALVACGLLTSAAVVGGLWGDRPFVRLMRRSLVVMALVALVIGTGILTVGWSLLGTQHTGRPYGPGSWLGAYTTVRSFTMVFIWPPTVFIAWVLGSMALLVGRQFGDVAGRGVKPVVRFPRHYAVCSSSSAWTTSSCVGSVNLFIDS